MKLLVFLAVVGIGCSKQIVKRNNHYGDEPAAPPAPSYGGSSGSHPVEQAPMQQYQAPAYGPPPSQPSGYRLKRESGPYGMMYPKKTSGYRVARDTNPYTNNYGGNQKSGYNKREAVGPYGMGMRPYGGPSMGGGRYARESGPYGGHYGMGGGMKGQYRLKRNNQYGDEAVVHAAAPEMPAPEPAPSAPVEQAPAEIAQAPTSYGTAKKKPSGY